MPKTNAVYICDIFRSYNLMDGKSMFRQVVFLESNWLFTIIFVDRFIGG